MYFWVENEYIRLTYFKVSKIWITAVEFQYSINFIQYWWARKLILNITIQKYSEVFVTDEELMALLWMCLLIMQTGGFRCISRLMYFSGVR